MMLRSESSDGFQSGEWRSKDQHLACTRDSAVGAGMTRTRFLPHRREMWESTEVLARRS